MWNWVGQAVKALGNAKNKGGGGQQFSQYQTDPNKPPMQFQTAPPNQVGGMMQPDMPGVSPQIQQMMQALRSSLATQRPGNLNLKDDLRKGGFLTGANPKMMEVLRAAIARARAQHQARQQPSAPPTSQYGPMAGGYQFPSSQAPVQAPPPVQTNPYGPFQ